MTGTLIAPVIPLLPRAGAVAPLDPELIQIRDAVGQLP